MGHDHEGQRVSRRRLFAGVSSLGLGTLLAACGSGNGTSATAVTTSTGATVTPEATTVTDLTSLFADAGTCKLTATTTQGPYYFDADKIRSDIREDKQGVLLRVAIKVRDSETCKPLPNAVVEIWHCDAAGLYSGAEAQSTEGGGNQPSGAPTGAPPSGAPGGGGGCTATGRHLPRSRSGAARPAGPPGHRAPAWGRSGCERATSGVARGGRGRSRRGRP
ncbi:hypothetical protein ETD86_40095, partial [Nonomuraea turkmeniaca]